ncbi:MAG: cyclic nucleotide-binding domain-containing protein [Cyanobacteriota bacterium]|nr:cyclic nucleotide-binding domain-containing protein [Cyanobacteriota bacterium]
MLEPIQTIAIFQKNCEPHKVAAGETIFKQGEAGKEMFGIIEGEVQFYINEKEAESLKAGDVFGEGALVNNEHTRRSTATAKTDCTLAILDKERFLFAIQQTPMFALEVMRSYSDRVNTLRHLI